MDNNTPSLQEQECLRKRFQTRARGVFHVRLLFWIFGISACVFEAWHPLHIDFSQQFSYFLFGLLAVNLLIFRIGVYHTHFGRFIAWMSFNLELVWLCFLIDQNNGLSSLLLATVPIYTALYALLFPAAWEIIPPLLVLPLITWLDLQDGIDISFLEQIWILGFYHILNGICIYFISYTSIKEEQQTRKLIQMEGQLQQLAVIKERQRIAREIHDGIGASLAGLILQSEYILRNVTHPALAEELKELRQTAEEALQDTRRSISVMREGFDFKSQLEQSYLVFSKRYQLPIQYHMDGTPCSLSYEQQHAVLRIMCEALNNIIQHANAKQVEIDIRFSKLALIMEIRDDGTGFNPQHSPKDHYGLLGMKERAKAHHGELHIHSVLGSGTTIKLLMQSTLQASSQAQWRKTE